jgi:hypothetical protein
MESVKFKNRLQCYRIALIPFMAFLWGSFNLLSCVNYNCNYLYTFLEVGIHHVTSEISCRILFSSNPGQKCILHSWLPVHERVLFRGSGFITPTSFNGPYSISKDIADGCFTLQLHIREALV